MAVRAFLAGLLVVGLGGSQAALAQQRPERAMEEVAERAENLFRIDNLTLQAGGGFTGLTERGSRNLTDLGGQWTARGILGAHRSFGLELAYVGLSLPLVAAPGEAADTDTGSLVSNGVEALARFGYPVQRGFTRITPYATAGLGWSYVSLMGANENPAGVGGSDNLFQIPLGVGLAANYGRLSLDARALYRRTFADDILRDAEGGAGMSNFTLGAAVGYSF